MKGSYIKRGNKWAFILDTKDERGARKRKWHSGYKTRKDAETACAALITAMAEGRYSEPNKISVVAYVRDCIEQWRAAEAITAKSAERYNALTAHQIEYLGDRPLQKLNASDIARWHVWMRTSGNKKTGGGVGDRTLRHAHALLAHCLTQAQRHNLISRNPAALERPGRTTTPRKEVQIVGEDQIAALLDKLVGREPMRTKVILALFCGLRRSEVLGLQWHDIDLDAKVLHVRRSLEQVGTTITVKGPKSRAGTRDISMPDIVCSALSEHRRSQLELRVRLGLGRPADDRFVFGHPLTGAAPSPPSLSAQWIATAESIGMPEITFHSLRHSHASMLISAGLDVVQISRRLGHSSPTITLSTYAHMFRKTDNAAAAINEALATLGARK
jgi:integrase